MKIEKIKPIPKYIATLIENAYKQSTAIYRNTTQFYTYLTKNDGELVQITVAVKRYQGKIFLKQVIIHGLHSDTCFCKDIAYYNIAGYIVGWYKEGISRTKKAYEDGEWGWTDDCYFNVTGPVVNKDYLKKFQRYKYSQVENYPYDDILNYLRLYEKYPQMELIMKLGLTDIVTSKTILDKTTKDKCFAKWLNKHKDEIKEYKYQLYVKSIIRAYDKNISLKEAQSFLSFAKNLSAKDRLKPVGKLFKGEQAIKRLLSYLKLQGINIYTYADYIDACNYLNIDLSIERNILPHDFHQWHDERIAQKKILEEERYRKWHEQWLKDQAKKERERIAKELKRQKELNELETKFARTAKKFSKLQNCEQDGFVIFIANSPAELIREGQELHHCVGGLNYRLRMSKAESLIFFVRQANEPDKPYVTLEYSPKNKEILQFHGDHNQKPNEQTIHFINNVWLPFAQTTTDKILKTKKAA